MAITHASCVWMLVLGACVGLAVGADCGKECALCVYRSLGQQASLTSLKCSLECEGGLDSRKLRLCRDALLEENHVSLDDNPDPNQQQQQEVVASEEEVASPEHQLAKKYGGFMKRYGGFMSRRSSSPSLEDPGNQEEEENVRLEILKILNAEAENGGAGGERGEAVKRYGGFMRRAGGVVQGDLLEAALGRGLKKRYGGFMRRVGRPEWLVDDAKSSSIGGGVLKRAWEDGGEVQKRYGGFMD